MKYSLLNKDFLNQKSDCLVILLTASKPVTTGKTLPAPLKPLDDRLNGGLANYLQSGDIKTNAGEISWLLTPDQVFKRILIIGLGKVEELSTSKLRKALATGMAALNESPVSKAIILPFDLSVAGSENFKSAETTGEIILALERARYSFIQCKSKEQQENQAQKPAKLKQVQFAADKKHRDAIGSTIVKADALAKGIALAKDLGNLPGNICTPVYLADQANDLAKRYADIKTTILGEKELKRLGMGSLLSVAAGSAQPPRLITMEYQGGKKGQKPHVLVGKGITFDSGGISLKPGAAMDEMKFDMCGAASVFGTLKALAELKAPLNVTGVIAAAENMPGSRATKPGDIVTSMSGQTIEILNTDAEGRLVLCDALTYCEKFKPETIIDIATLTGACVIALGHETAGLLANDDKLAGALLEAGDKAGDRAWQLPLFEEYQQQLDSNFADMQNIGGRSAGTITAACFLSRFTKKYRWAHLDIAGVAWHSGANKGATGRPVGLLTEYLLATDNASNTDNTAKK